MRRSRWEALREALFAASAAIAGEYALECMGVLPARRLAGARGDVELRYTNWRGETRVRRIRPVWMEFRESAWHKGAQWIVVARDLESGELRDFALSGFRGPAAGGSAEGGSADGGSEESGREQ